MSSGWTIGRTTVQSFANADARVVVGVRVRTPVSVPLAEPEDPEVISKRVGRMLVATGRELELDTDLADVGYVPDERWDRMAQGAQP